MKAQGLARIGRDAETRFLQNGDAVTSLSLAFSFGKKDESGNRQTQWVDAAMWGKRGETLAPYLLKGSQVVAYLEDVRIESFEGKNGPSSKLAAKVVDIELISGQQQGQQAAPQQQRQAPPQRPAPQPQRQSTYQAPAPSGFDGLDDDIPF
jgi:single-strand DNA-binding protein